ncbi:MAG: PilN domain-containing protein [Hyphomonadaceae bacterium]|nr:PilN domain-containing protein [Clostridia bacterium]
MTNVKNSLNFLPVSIAQRKARGEVFRLVLLMCVLGFVTALSLMIIPVSEVFTMRSDVQTMKARKAELANVLVEENKLKIAEQAYKIRENILVQIAANDPNALYILDQIEAVIPKDTLIANMSTTKTGEVTISGVTKTKASLAEFIYRLKQCGVFDKVFSKNIVDIQGAVVQEAPVKGKAPKPKAPAASKSFVLKCTLKQVKGK